MFFSALGEQFLENTGRSGFGVILYLCLGWPAQIGLRAAFRQKIDIGKRL
jgi:hypothetical protein